MRSFPFGGDQTKADSLAPACASIARSIMRAWNRSRVGDDDEKAVERGYFAGLAGCTGVGPGCVGLIGDSGCVGVTSAPASFAALNVVPGGVGGGRRSMTKLVWFTTNRNATETAAMMVAIIAGFLRTNPITVNR
jgi:hypothetical protein